jgi:dienelactone hydrolase
MRYRVYRAESISGPAVFVLHELPGLYKEDITLARMLGSAGFTVYVPLFFGKPFDYHPYRFGLTECLFPWSLFPALYPGHISRVARWLNAIIPAAHAECGQKGVGVVGMCMTGSLPLATAESGLVPAVVLCQPTFPVVFHSRLDIDDRQICVVHDKKVDVLALKFSRDPKSPDARWRTLNHKLGDRLTVLLIRSGEGSSIPADSHSVLGHGFDPAGASPTRQAFERVVRFLDNRLSDHPKTEPYPDAQPCPKEFICQLPA